MTKLSGGVINAQINENITYQQIRLINENGEMVGIVKTKDALAMAYESDLDLVLISCDSEYPVCKILDYGKYKYAMQKKKIEAKKKQKTIDIKEIQLRPSIGDNDLNVKCRAAERFLKSGDKVKLVLRLRGRETGKQELGLSVINKVIDFVSEYAKEESAPKVDGQSIIVILVAK